MGLIPVPFGRIHKVHCAENISVVGHGHGRHAQFLRPLTELLHVASAVEHRVVGVEMEVDELGHVKSGSEVQASGFRLWASGLILPLR